LFTAKTCGSSCNLNKIVRRARAEYYNKYLENVCEKMAYSQTARLVNQGVLRRVLLAYFWGTFLFFMRIRAENAGQPQRIVDRLNY
jgi:hypothetical protein